VTTTTRPPATRPVPTTGPSPAWWVLVGVVLLGLLVTFARLRWPGLVPIGSDNDEYRMVGEALARFEPPVVAGVEGTKYPLGYPALLAVLHWSPFPVVGTAQALNLVALVAVAGGLAWIAGRPRPDRPASPGAALAAAGLVVTSAAVWNDVHSIMPELFTLLVVTAMLVAVDRPIPAQRYGLLTGLAVAAVLLKTMASLIVGGAVLALVAASWLADRRGAQAGGRTEDGRRPLAALWRPLVPGVVAAGTVLAGMLLMRPYPVHTTGYVAMFTLADPDDASLGRLGIGGLVRRTLDDVPWTVMDLGRAITVVDATRRPAITIAIVGLTLGVVGAWRLGRGTPLGPVALGMVVLYAVGMTTWPYHSARFGLPLVPVAALGAGWLAQAIGRAGGRVIPSRVLGLVAGAAIVAALAAVSLPRVAAAGEESRERFPREHAAVDTVAAWARDHDVDDGAAASMDYREIARVMDRRVLPIGYTSDPDGLWAQVEDADHLVVLDLYGKRTRQVEILLETYPERFTPVLEDGGVRIFDVRP
jgi:hypothetical protein